MGLVCISNESLLVYSKSQKVSVSYCLPFQLSRGKNQPVGGFRPSACLGLSTCIQLRVLSIPPYKSEILDIYSVVPL